MEKMNVLEYIQLKRQMRQHLLAVLLDPERPIRFEKGELDGADLVFVGGSTGVLSSEFIEQIRTLTHRPIVLFPGNAGQFTAKADALLFLSMLSSRNPEVLIGQQVEVAATVKESGIETIPMGYILIEGGKKSSVEQASHSAPIPQTDIAQICSTAIAGELLGHQLIYLEAGSGALNPVSVEIIRKVRAAVSLPLIVGGGITSPEAMTAAYKAGADIVVIGNHLEQHPDQLKLFCR